MVEEARDGNLSSQNSEELEEAEKQLQGEYFSS